MGKRLVSLLTALALAVSAFASLAVAPAGAQTGPETPGLRNIYFPFVPNGEELAGTGPWYGTITVQNVEDEPIRVEVLRANGQKVTTVVLNLHGSRTWTSAAIFGDDPGGGVQVVGCFDNDNTGGCFDDTDPDNPGPQTDDEPARIAGVMKSAAPVAPTGDARTSSQHESVTGYSALPMEAVQDNQQWALPIVQSGWNGWNSVIYITNFSNEDNCAVDVTLYESPLGLGDPAPGSFSEMLDKGETWQLDLTGWNEDWAGSAFIDADCAVAVSSDRIKAEQPWGDPVNMAISNVGQPFGEASTEVYAPLVFQRYNGWNTGMAVVNLSDSADAHVTINFYNMDGNTAGSATLTLRPRAVEWVYRPELTNLGTMSIAQARITADQKVAVAVDEVKYSGTDPDTGQAMSYNAQVGGGTLALPLFQKQGGALASSNDNSGIAIFNPNNADNNVTVTVYNRAGNEYASIVYRIDPWGSAILYAPEDLPELQGGFTGNVVVTAADAPVVAVSNNVNYDVQYDGSAAFNLAVVAEFEAPPVPTYQLTLDPDAATNLAGEGIDHTVTATLTLDGDPVPGKPILFEILDGSVHDDAAEDDAGTYNAAGSDDAVVNTNLTGQAQFTVADTGDTGTDTIFACADLNNTGTCDPGEPTATAVKYWVTATFNASLDATVGVNDDTADGNATVTVDGPAGSSLPVVLVITDVSADASFAPCSLADQNVLADTAGTGANNYSIYVCAGDTGDTFDVAAYWDVNNNGQYDAGTDVQLSGSPITVTLS